MTSPMARPAARSGHKDKGIRTLAWISWIFALVGGATVTATFVGDMIAGVIEFFPGWVGSVLLAGGVVATVIDLYIDGIPNRLAIMCALLIPSIARSVPGRLGSEVTKVSTELAGKINEAVGVWLGTSSSVGLAIGCAVVSMLVARRVIAKGGR